MESDVAGLCQAAPGERTAIREIHRNGYREREFQTRLGELVLPIPKLRRGSYFPAFLEPRRRWEQAFVNVAAEALRTTNPSVVTSKSRASPALMPRSFRRPAGMVMMTAPPCWRALI